MSKLSGFVGDEKPLLLLLLTMAAADPEPLELDDDDFFMLGDVGVRLHEALLLFEWIPLLLLLLLLMLLLLVIRSDTNVL